MRQTTGMRATMRRLFFHSILALQATRPYRWLVQTVHPVYSITEATDEELRAVYRWFDPEGTSPPILRHPGVTDFVARSGKAIIGFVQAIYYSDETNPLHGWWLFSLQVRLRWRGMGVGRALCERVIEHVRSAGAREIALLVQETNRPAIDLYMALGFERATPDLEEHLNTQGFAPEPHRITMRKRL
jgi:GNAT superfamily N-acetyltransferase